MTINVDTIFLAAAERQAEDLASDVNKALTYSDQLESFNGWNDGRFIGMVLQDHATYVKRTQDGLSATRRLLAATSDARNIPAPEISPVLARMVGAEFHEALSSRLLELAEETDDPAYARRLREVAAGERPLRTLAMDPGWSQQFSKDASDNPSVPTLDEEQREELRKKMERARRHIHPPADPAESTALVREVMRLAERTQQIIQNDELTGWGRDPEPQNKNPNQTPDS